jgi:C4-dicarboxylate-specific signal transduction histidine kinase
MRKPIRRVIYSFLNFQHLVLLGSILFFLIIGTAFFLVYQNAVVMREQIDSDFNQQQLILARQAVLQIEDNLQDMTINLDNLIKLLSKIPQEDWEEVMHLSVERRRSIGLLEIGIVDPEGRRLVAHSADSLTAPLSQDVLTDCRWGSDGSMVLGPLLVMNVPPGKPTIVGVLCRRMGSGSLEGNTLFARLDLSQLISSTTSHIRSGKTGYCWAVSEEGVFLSHPEQDFVGKNAFTARKEREPTISFKQINLIMKDRMLLGYEGTGTYVSGWHRGIQGGDITKLIAFAPVRSSILPPGQVWSVAVAAPISEVAEPVHQMYIRNFATEAALLIGMFVFGMFLVIYQNRTSQILRQRVKETEADLHEIERIYERMVEQATDLIYIFDLEMRFVILNRQTVDMFVDLLMTEEEGLLIPEGARKADEDFWKGKKLDDLMLQSDAAFVRKKIDEVLEKNRSITFEHTIKPKGRLVRLSTKYIPIRDDQGRVHYVLGISRDITEKMEMDQRIYSAEKLASIGILASGVAHEINNPLAVILGFTDLLLERVPEGSQEREDLQTIEQSARHAQKVVQNLLGFARVTEGLDETVALKDSIDMVMKIVMNTLMTKKIDFITEIPEDLPRVRGDTREFQQVIFNLINNSVAAMAHRDGGDGKLILSARADQEWVHVSVVDNGIGIPNRIKPQILDPFFTTKKAGEGTGLGLSLCYGIVKKYGGKLSFSSASAEDYPDRPTGTTFVVSMPIYRPQEDRDRFQPGEMRSDL